jgi:hypothetical protein
MDAGDAAGTSPGSPGSTTVDVPNPVAVRRASLNNIRAANVRGATTSTEELARNMRPLSGSSPSSSSVIAIEMGQPSNRRAGKGKKPPQGGLTRGMSSTLHPIRDQDIGGGEGESKSSRVSVPRQRSQSDLASTGGTEGLPIGGLLPYDHENIKHSVFTNRFTYDGMALENVHMMYEAMTAHYYFKKVRVRRQKVMLHWWLVGGEGGGHRRGPGGVGGGGPCWVTGNIGKGRERRERG